MTRAKASLVETTVSVRISPFTGAHDGFQLAIVDDRSGVGVFECELTYDELGQILANRGAVVPAKLTKSPLHGLFAHVRREMVPMPPRYRFRGYDASAWHTHVALWAPDDLTDWSPDIDPSFNRHRLSDDRYEVMFRRWAVEPQPQAERGR